jgi:hypothetical protein
MQVARKVSTELRLPLPPRSAAEWRGGGRGGGMHHDATNNGLNHSIHIIEHTMIE